MILSYIRTIVLYLVLIVVIRVMGKRQVGQMEPSEFVVTMLVANLAAIPMQDGGIPLFSGLVKYCKVVGGTSAFSSSQSPFCRATRTVEALIAFPPDSFRGIMWQVMPAFGSSCAMILLYSPVT